MISLTIALLYVFVTGYASGLALNEVAIEELFRTGITMPAENFFEIAWSGVYFLQIALLTATIADRKLRKYFPLWLVSGALGITCCHAFFSGDYIFSLGIIIELSLISMLLCRKYIEKSRLLWVFQAPITIWYIYLSVVNFMVVAAKFSA